MSTLMPIAFPATRITFVAPTFLLPTVRTSIPFKTRTVTGDTVQEGQPRIRGDGSQLFQPAACFSAKKPRFRKNPINFRERGSIDNQGPDHRGQRQPRFFSRRYTVERKPAWQSSNGPRNSALESNPWISSTRTWWKSSTSSTKVGAAARAPRS